MSQGITIRRGTTDDLDQVMALARDAETAPHWQAADYHAIFHSHRLLLVAERVSQIIGFVVAHDIAGEWELENIAVAPSRRRSGIGKVLVEALIAEASKDATKSILLEVRESNTAAKLLYERCGFHQYGRRRGYYSNPSEDGLLYRFLCTPATLENC